jgi:hypothetical protein
MKPISNVNDDPKAGDIPEELYEEFFLRRGEFKARIAELCGEFSAKSASGPAEEDSELRS